MDEGLGKRFWLKTVGLVIGCGILILISWFLISSLVFRFGLIAALVVVFVVAGLIAHHYDTKQQRRYTDGM
jgi:high-affinity Fe2+/Pb2+ permease